MVDLESHSCTSSLSSFITNYQEATELPNILIYLKLHIVFKKSREKVKELFIKFKSWIQTGI